MICLIIIKIKEFFSTVIMGKNTKKDHKQGFKFRGMGCWNAGRMSGTYEMVCCPGVPRDVPPGHESLIIKLSNGNHHLVYDLNRTLIEGVRNVL